MSNKIDERLPLGHGKGLYPDHAGIQTPWDKVIAMKEAIHYLSRYNSVVSAAVMQAWRIMVPDYALRSKVGCEEAYARLYEAGKAQSVNNQGLDSLNIHPFCSGAYVAGLSGDSGDEMLLMCGRVNDFGTYRVEKELDVCDWDICGTELCRATTMSLQAGADSRNKELMRTGPCMEYCMVEARGAGDRHCRIVAECRKKYPMPEHEIWESFGPVATADQIKFTKEEDCVSESQVFRADANYRYESGTHQVEGPTSVGMNQYCCAATFYLLPAIEESIKRGLVTEEMALHTLKCVCEAAGKAAWGDQTAKEAHRQWLGVPREMAADNGRILGAHIEFYLQAMGVDYKLEAFNKDEVIIDFNRYRLGLGYNKFVDCLLSYWFGMSKTLLSAEWACWEEPGETTHDRCRIKIAKKIDKFC